MKYVYKKITQLIQKQNKYLENGSTKHTKRLKKNHSFFRDFPIQHLTRTERKINKLQK